MTPSTMRAGGAGELIRYTTAPTPLGQVLIAATARGICTITFQDDDPEQSLKQQFPRATLKQMDRELSYAVDEPSSPPSRKIPAPSPSRSTSAPPPSSSASGRALRHIPLGETRTYSQLATELGSPAAVRAVANACASNPLALAVPCHRVIGKNGTLTGYRWGLDRKRQILQNESALPVQQAKGAQP